MTDIYEKLLKSDFILKVKNFFLASEIPTKTHGYISERYTQFLYNGKGLIKISIVFYWVFIFTQNNIIYPIIQKKKIKCILETSKHSIKFIFVRPCLSTAETIYFINFA